ncbi:MAG TPA: protein kinase, partial [Tepidisphaeraceae bacterium]|nr:protein kinase [Tepidisphaeraceae bacterium]
MGSQSNKAAAIFDAAVELKSPTERAAYLDGACGCNAQLRIQVEELLAHDDAAGSFLESPTLVNPPVGDGGVGPGLVIGPYKLLEQIGEGGMGAVFMAEQTHPVHRKVALKIIRAGMDSRQIVARFEAERQALALMDHPNIAKVLDGGTVGEQGPRESGTLAGRPPRSHLAANGAGVAPARPYFVMELVKGIAIIKYCDENRLTPRQRLELFIPICQAVQHAHQKGIIHRDLKPSNVMVCQYDGKPVPKIIDFGIAKATGQKLTEHTLFTEFGTVVGTLEYMSPEQAEMNQLDIDTRSDIYSLGVLLYELLTGTTPLERGRLKEAAFLEVLRLIREEEPPRPSTRLSTQEALPSIAANRGLEPAKLGGIVRGELDWIVMKCLEKDRSRRYETANGLARDLERYLADEPVQACPPSTRYRLRKFARRNKRALVTAGLLAGTMVLAVALLSVSYLRLKVEQARTASEYHRAEAQKLVAEQQRGEAELQKGIADQQRREAEDRLGLVFEALDEVFVKEGEARELLRNRPTERQAMDPQREKAEREFTERGLRFYEKLAAKPGTSPAAQAEMASAFRRVGRIQNGLRRPKEAEHAFRESLELVEKLINQFPETWEYKLEKADTLQWLVVPIADSGRNAEADELTRQALKIIHSLPPELRDGGNARRWTARCHRRLGKSLAASGRIAEAIPELLEGERCLEQLAIDFPNEPYANGVAESRMTRAICLADSGRLDEAVAVYAAAAAMYEKLIAESATGSDDNAWYRRELGYCCNLRGGKLRVLGRLAEAEAVLSQGTKIYQKLVSEFPANETNKSRLTWNETELGQLYKD